MSEQEYGCKPIQVATGPSGKRVLLGLKQSSLQPPPAKPRYASQGTRRNDVDQITGQIKIR